MQKEKLVPEIRFKGFEEDYIGNKTIDVLNIERGASPRPINNYLTKSGINWVKISDAPADGYYITQTEDKIIPDGIKFSKQVFPGDLILSNSMSFGRPYIMGITGCIHDGWLKISDRNNKFDSVYLCTLLGTEQMIKKYKSLAAGSTVSNLSKELVGSTHILYPVFDEQQKIGQFFSNLDSLIRSQELKLKKINEVKQSLLNKMFASENQKFPEIRFSGYNTEWNLKTLEQIAEITFGQSPLSIYYTDKKTDHILVQGNADVKNRWVYPRIYTSQITKRAFTGDIIFSVRAPVGSVARSNYDIVIGRGIAAIKGDDFIYFNLLWKEISQFWKSKSSGSTFDSIASSELDKSEISVPSDLSEQQRIGAFFSSLDSLIRSQELKLEKLNNIKQALLEKMFC
ncbi:restriction endonuclease subunit S [Mycoplasma sp. Z244B]|uniref:restriction endonuclease subunit S n=1 Tax=Mycoplasma sp. Z244B TaxID=3401659 RepID=UPI003AAC4A4C